MTYHSLTVCTFMICNKQPGSHFGKAEYQLQCLHQQCVDTVKTILFKNKVVTNADNYRLKGDGRLSVEDRIKDLRLQCTSLWIRASAK